MKGEIARTGEKMYLHTAIGGNLVEIEESLGWIRLKIEGGARDWLGWPKTVNVSFTSEDAQLIAAGINELCQNIRYHGEKPKFVPLESKSEDAK